MKINQIRRTASICEIDMRDLDATVEEPAIREFASTQITNSATQGQCSLWLFNWGLRFLVSFKSEIPSQEDGQRTESITFSLQMRFPSGEKSAMRSVVSKSFFQWKFMEAVSTPSIRSPIILGRISYLQRNTQQQHSLLFQ